MQHLHYFCTLARYGTGPNTANSEMTGDESPSRMRTRNKTTKESSNKRPKRGGDTPETSATNNEIAKTPNKTDRRKSSKETPTKGKKRTNLDVDTDNDGSDEKEKRKRTDSPTESLNSDSRPESVMDEQENTSDPPENPLAGTDRKDDDTGAYDANNSSLVKEEKVDAAAVNNDTVEPSNETDLAATKPKSNANDDSSNSNDDASEADVKPSIAATKPTDTVSTHALDTSSKVTSTFSGSIAPITTVSTVEAPVATTSVTSMVCSSASTAAATDPSHSNEVDTLGPKEQDMAVVANIKREMPPTEYSADYEAKKMPVFIKKEPGDEQLDNGSATNISTNDGPSDMKLAQDIKTENKCGLDLTDADTKTEDGSRDSHIRYNPLHKPEPNYKYGMDMGKPNDPLKFGIEAKYAMVAADLSQKYETKPFVDPSLHKIPVDGVDKPSSDVPAHADPSKPMYPIEPIESKYHPHNIDMKYPENMAIKRPPYTEPSQNMRSPYDTSPMHKYSEAMHKYPAGVPSIMSSPLPGYYSIPMISCPNQLLRSPNSNIIHTNFSLLQFLRTR